MSDRVSELDLEGAMVDQRSVEGLELVEAIESRPAESSGGRRHFGYPAAGGVGDGGADGHHDDQVGGWQGGFRYPSWTWSWAGWEPEARHRAEGHGGVRRAVIATGSR